MIDFRYHLVSIVAIFLALTVGIVLGSTVLQEPLIRSTEELTAQLQQSNDDFRKQNTGLLRREAGYDAFVTAVAPQLLRGLLTGERVVIVEAPGSDAEMIEPVTEALVAAGASVTGRVTLTDKYLAPDQSGLIDQLAATVKPAEVTFPEQATPYDKAATVLAGAVVTGSSTESGKKDASSSAVLGAFEDAGLISIDEDPAQRAGMAVVIAPTAVYEGQNAETETGAMVALASALDSAGKGTVVAGTTAAAGSGGVLTAIRDTGEVATNVSTLDTLDMAAGRAVLVYALREQLDGGSGQYGLGPAAGSFLPTASPTPSPTAGSGG
ncbi:copper transporter [Thermopolyspora sp. NPDC052614]|uniref:copper transporter n=1 Tax=Thermopolyspora sp. NPDC052614 TaxID=3155682 RepID=UPI00343930A2